MFTVRVTFFVLFIVLYFLSRILMYISLTKINRGSMNSPEGSLSWKILKKNLRISWSVNFLIILNAEICSLVWASHFFEGVPSLI